MGGLASDGMRPRGHDDDAIWSWWAGCHIGALYWGTTWVQASEHVLIIGLYPGCTPWPGSSNMPSQGALGGIIIIVSVLGIIVIFE